MIKLLLKLGRNVMFIVLNRRPLMKVHDFFTCLVKIYKGFPALASRA